MVKNKPMINCYPSIQTFDVIIVGSGQGGFCAALSAAMEGAKVALVEISSNTGGAASYSLGDIHNMEIKKWDDFVELSKGRFNPELSKVWWENYPTHIQWLIDIGAYITRVDPLTAKFGKGEPFPINCRMYFDSLEKILKKVGGTLFLNSRALKILTNEDGQVTGLKVKTLDGSLVLKGSVVVLACGGFFSNLELRQKYLGHNSYYASVLGTPYNMGDGLKMAQDVGASLSGAMHSFAGCLGPALPFKNPQIDRKDYENRGYTTKGKGEYWLLGCFKDPRERIFVNRNGKRFIDENRTDVLKGKHTYYQGTSFMLQPFAEAYSVFDGPMWDKVKDKTHTHTDLGSLSHEHVLNLISQYGGIVLLAETILELAEKLEIHGAHKINFIKTIEKYNKYVQSSKTRELEVPRTGITSKIETPPFYAVPITQYIFHTHGGVAINKNAQVLDMQCEPISGLYAVPPTATSICDKYVGGIGLAGTFGYIAGKQAAFKIKDQL